MSVSKKLSPLLWLLLGLFCFRVLAQLLQSMFSFEFLPPFAAWHSAALPYSVLLLSQVLIIVVMTHVCIKFTQGRVVATRKPGILLLVFGAIYFLAMLGRLLLGLLVLPDHDWFGQILPAVFHIVLALFVLLLGHFHYSHYDSTMQP